VTLGAEYEIRREGRWRLAVLPEKWDRELWNAVLSRLDSAAPRKHPQTVRLGGAPADGASYYLKIYSPPAGAAALKDLFRDSKALRALKQGLALSRFGFHAPPALAAGEERTFGALGRAFLLTREITAAPLAAALRKYCAPPLDRHGVRKKRQWLKQLALETGRLHRRGFVHGDLVASNILARLEADGGATFFYMDNDRTRRYPAWFPHRLWRRNLVQLNRIVLPGISLQDRMRFLRIYLGETSWAKREYRLIRWLEKKTRERRRECEHVEAEVSFRELMRWNGPFAKNL
jgi:hypothetical protein